jgi:alginate O-acetyltransferase complex protein AlgI
MVFSNLVFLFMFLPVVLVATYIIRPKLRNIVLLAFSLFFYAWGEPQYIFLMLFSIAINYIFGLMMGKFEHHKSLKQFILAFAVLGNLAVLGYYKYSQFLMDNLNSLFGLSIELEPVPLPIGISFYTFQAMSYVIDVYRKDGYVQKNPINLALYVALFPQLIAGPIIRYNDIMDQLKSRVTNVQRFSEGIQIFILGLAKKVLIANQMAVMADEIFAKQPSEISVSLAWLGIIAYTLQIYFDFSGYSDMAVGLGKMFGFDFPRNFNYPYISKSISEFWRRWHITLSSWFRDYVYIPLGGNRVSKFKVYRNIFIVWTLTGFWHGASWTFIAWGFYYGLIIAIEKAGWGKVLSTLWAPIQHFYVVLLFMIGWVFFRADNFTYSIDYIQTMFGLNGRPFMENITMYYLNDYSIVLLVAILFSMPVYEWGKTVIKKYFIHSFTKIMIDLLHIALILVLFVVSITHLVNSTYNPFIYFRF